jgi:hypothetical protein
MPTSRATDALPLTGADCFLRAFDAETRRRNGASHLSQLVLRLGPGFDLAAFREVLSRVVDANPILRAPIARRLGVGAPVYRLADAPRALRPRVAVHALDEPAPGGATGTLAVPPVVRARLNDVFAGRRGELLKVDAAQWAGGSGTDLAFTWLHMLLDGAGSEQFVAFLEACRSGARTPDAVPDADRPGAPPEVALPAGARERGAMATGWQRRMGELGALRVRSLAGPLRGVAQELDYAVRVFSEAETARVRERASRLAGFLTPMLFYLCAAIRAHHAVWLARGAVPESYVVPLPVNLRPKGGEGGMFRTRVSMLWFGVRGALAGDLAALLQQLKEQRRAAIRDKHIEAGVAAMDWARLAPARVYARMARRPLGGELCSFFFAYTDEFCAGVDRFFGAPLLHGFHAPSVPASPGSGLVFSLHGGRLHAVHVRQRGVLDAAEQARFDAQLARDLLGGE